MKLSTRYQPLYKQVYEVLLKRLIDGDWKLATALPSEHALAAELGVSQGTVRKALSQMVTENLLYRQQGKGTYVVEHTQEKSLFRFFRFREPNGENLIPKTKMIAIKRRLARTNEQKQLKLNANAKVVEMTRVRSLQGTPMILERVVQPLSIFPDIDKGGSVPNSLYTLYQEKYGISIVEVTEELRATKIKNAQTEHLDLAVDSPILYVERVSFTVGGRPVEYSEAFCNTKNFIYSVSLR